MGRVHMGFADALERIWNDIDAALAGLEGELLCTGHSLGAALATLAASRRPGSRLITFGSPRVGDDDFVAALEDQADVSRFVNCCDLVTRLPPFPYKHVGRLHYLDRDGAVVEEPENLLVARDRRRARISYFFGHSWRFGNVFLRSLADHAPINYVSALREG